MTWYYNWLYGCIDISDGSPVDLGKLIADGRYAGMRIEPAPSASHVTMDFISATSCSSSNSEQLGRLELIDEYDEKYLRARPLVNGN